MKYGKRNGKRVLRGQFTVFTPFTLFDLILKRKKREIYRGRGIHIGIARQTAKPKRAILRLETTMKRSRFSPLAATVAALAALAIASGCAPGIAAQPSQSLGDGLKAEIDKETYREIHADGAVVKIVHGNPPSIFVRGSDIYDLPAPADEQPAEAPQEQQEAAEGVEAPEEVYEPEWDDYEAYSGSQALHSPDGFAQQGVRHHEGRTETWYSGDAVYTDQLTLDEEGYYRDSEGRYAVAVGDMPEGTVFETSKGEAVVVDGGCDEGVTDFYVDWS